MTVDLPALSAPTPGEEIKQRQGPRGVTLDYVDARWVMERLDAACGPENWQDQYIDLPNGSVRCGIGIKVDGVEWVWKFDVGDPSDIEPTKGAYSDAFKRAAVKWSVARDLYGAHEKPQNGSRTPVEPRSAPQRETVVMSATPRPTVVPNTPAEPDDEGWEGLLAGTVAVAVREECPTHHQPWKTVPAGTSKAGKPYSAFRACPVRDCKERPR